MIGDWEDIVKCETRLKPQQRESIIAKLRELGMTEEKLNAYKEGNENSDLILYFAYHNPDKVETIKKLFGTDKEHLFDKFVKMNS